MATRSPTEAHAYWGRFATAAALPNVAASPTQKSTLETGDSAYVTGTSTLYVCTTATLGAAVWAAVPTGAFQADRYYDIVVGNSPAGDTLSVCDYLDTGNGEQLQAALTAAAAASPKKTVFVRRGTYDRGAAGSTGAPITVGAGVLLVGDGKGMVTIKSAANPNALATKTIKSMDISGEVRDVGFSVPNLTSADSAANTAVVRVQQGGTLRTSTAVMAAQGTPARLGTIQTVFQVDQGGTVIDVSSSGAPDFAGDGTTLFSNLEATSTALIQTYITRFTSTNGGVGVRLTGAFRVDLDTPHVVDATYIGIYIVAPTSSDMQLSNPDVTWSAGAGLQRFGIKIESSAAGNIDTVRIFGGDLDCFSDGVFGSIGLYILANAAGSVNNTEVVGINIVNFDEAARVEATGGGTVAANGIVNSFVSNNVAGINNISDAAFRTGGNY